MRTDPVGCSAQYIAHNVPPMHQPSSVSSSSRGRSQRLAHRPVQLIAHELGESHLGVLFVGDAPIDKEDVESLREHELDERVSSSQVEDLGPIDEREHEQYRNRVLTAA